MHDVTTNVYWFRILQLIFQLYQPLRIAVSNARLAMRAQLEYFERMVSLNKWTITIVVCI